MTKTPFISTRFFVPDEWVSQTVLETQLLVYPQSRRDDEPKPPIPLYDAESYPGYIGLPIDWGIRTYGHRAEIEDRTVRGRAFDPPSRPDPFHPNVLDPHAQQQFMDDMLDALDEDYAVMAVAPPGSGKTVVGLNTAAELGRSTLIIAPLQRIANQWIKGAQDFLGMKRSEIGLVQGPKCEYDRRLCVGIINSITAKDYPPEFYHAFGTVIWDEVHRFGSQRFSQSIAMFPAAYKIAMTATPDERKDGAADVYLRYFGKGQVVSTSASLPCKVHVLRYTKKGDIFGEDDHNVALQCLTRDRVRNELLVRIILKLYEHGRTILGMGESIDHIEMIGQMLKERGIPDAEVGQFTGEHTDERGIRVKTGDDYLDWCKEKPRIILATKGMMKLGVDVPRLDAGVELTPLADATQALGRVRRPLEGKEQALWYSILDTRFGMYYGFYQARKKDYREDDQIRVIEHGQTPDKGKPNARAAK